MKISWKILGFSRDWISRSPHTHFLVRVIVNSRNSLGSNLVIFLHRRKMAVSEKLYVFISVPASGIDILHIFRQWRSGIFPSLEWLPYTSV